MVYVWTKESATDNLTLDFLHKQLFEAVHDLMDDCSSERGRANLSSSVQFLIDYIATHSSGEEILQEQYLYPDSLARDERHTAYTAYEDEMTQRFQTEGATVVLLAKLNSGADA